MPVAASGSGGSDLGAALLDNGDFFTATNPIGANGGGANTNEYTIVMDIKTASTGFNALLDMDEGSDGEIFINGLSGVGISSNYDGTVNDDAWHRLAIVFDLDSGGQGSDMLIYLDGSVLSYGGLGGPSAAGTDGRWSLLSTFTAFSDVGGGEEEPTNVSNLALFSTALSASEVSALGAAGTPIPEPTTLLLGLVGLLSLCGVSRRTR